MFNAKVLQGLFKQLPQNEKIHEILMASDPPTHQAQGPFLRMLRSLSSKEFSSFCDQHSLRLCNFEKCDLRASLLMGGNPEKFGSADPDTVYAGIMALTKDLFAGEKGKYLCEMEHQVIFKLLAAICASETVTPLSDLLYTVEFMKRLEVLKNYVINTATGPTSYYCYLKRTLQSNQERYAKLETPREVIVIDDTLDQFIHRTIDRSLWVEIITSCIADDKFRVALLKHIVDRSQTEDNNNTLSRMYAILLIFYTRKEIQVAHQEYLAHTINRTDIGAIISCTLTGAFTGIDTIITLVKSYLMSKHKHLLQSVAYETNIYLRTANVPQSDCNIVSAIHHFCQCNLN